MYHKFIVTSGTVFGHFGQGTNVEEAVRKWKKSGGKKKDGNYCVRKITSDAWIGRDGSLNYTPDCIVEIIKN